MVIGSRIIVLPKPSCLMEVWDLTKQPWLFIMIANIFLEWANYEQRRHLGVLLCSCVWEKHLTFLNLEQKEIFPTNLKRAPGWQKNVKFKNYINWKYTEFLSLADSFTIVLTFKLNFISPIGDPIWSLVGFCNLCAPEPAFSNSVFQTVLSGVGFPGHDTPDSQDLPGSPVAEFTDWRPWRCDAMTFWPICPNFQQYQTRRL